MIAPHLHPGAVVGVVVRRRLEKEQLLLFAMVVVVFFPSPKHRINILGRDQSIPHDDDVVIVFVFYSGGCRVLDRGENTAG
jgi:hypothetical protein